MVPLMEVIVCAFRLCVALTVAPSLLLGKPLGLSSGYGSVEGFADIQLISTMRVLMLLPANRDHFPETTWPLPLYTE